MKELLNKLIKKGRVPFGDKRITNVSLKMQYVGTYNWLFWSNHNAVEMWKSTIEICSKSSGLWQFVCENEMIKKPDIDRGEVHNWDNPNHWLCESALKDESELEDFLLSNIKVDG